jgi:hypothetical protein
MVEIKSLGMHLAETPMVLSRLRIVKRLTKPVLVTLLAMPLNSVSTQDFKANLATVP